MSVHSSLWVNANAIPAIWRQRLTLLFIIACFAIPLATAWLLVGRWQPGSSVQHGELLNPAQPLKQLRFVSLEGQPLNSTALSGRWVMIYASSAHQCESACKTALYDMRQVRIALGKDIERVKTLLLLDGLPDAGLRQWLTAEHAAMMVGVADVTTRSEFDTAFSSSPETARQWIYLLDPLGNLLMRYPVAVEPRGMLKDLQRLLRLSKIG
ncbi:MAG: hypothetical protein HC889_03535 [Synechococcaceae cyanobacterium SM1_2_3]|nr:hypothetical protein [Synechococcaceae cyanobacterium SM1_2_3]